MFQHPASLIREKCKKGEINEDNSIRVGHKKLLGELNRKLVVWWWCVTALKSRVAFPDPTWECVV